MSIISRATDVSRELDYWKRRTREKKIITICRRAAIKKGSTLSRASQNQDAQTVARCKSKLQATKVQTASCDRSISTRTVAHLDNYGGLKDKDKIMHREENGRMTGEERESQQTRKSECALLCFPLPPLRSASQVELNELFANHRSTCCFLQLPDQLET